MYILGISALYHDSAACLIKDGVIIAAAQEERFTRKKHDSGFPINAIQYCFQKENITVDDLECIVYYDQPYLTLQRFISNALALGIKAKPLVETSWEKMFHYKLWIHEIIKQNLGGLGKRGVLLTTKHHISHAASAFYPSPYNHAIILSIDGVGEWSTTTIGIGNGNRIRLCEEIRYPHSLGLFYSAFTYFCGFKVNSGDYKFMGLAPYGEPIYYDAIVQNVIDIKEDGSFCLNLDFFDYQNGGTMINEANFSALFNGGRRLPESVITKREMDIAASVQKVTENVILRIVRHAKEIYGPDIDNLVMAGGVALNCVANGIIQNSGIFKNVWIQPAAGDAGGALGAALYVYYNEYHAERNTDEITDFQKGSLLGPEFSNDEIKSFLESHNYKYVYLPPDKRESIIAQYLAEEKVIGLMQGRMEFGPRALGNRSIIADSRSKQMQSLINLKVKFRESFRPFAPIVLAEDIHEFFDLNSDSPYMLKVGKVIESRRKPFNLSQLLEKNGGDMIEVVNQSRSDIPAVTHVDFSARIQTVDEARNQKLYSILSEYKKMTGIGVLVNTSFNVRGEPIVCSYKEAYECFMRTELDILVLENYMLFKCDQPTFEEYCDWRQIYELD